MTEQHPERVERAIEMLVLAPIGLAATLKDMSPMMMAMLVNRGRTEVEQRQQQLQTVKSTGEVAIAFGVPMLREKVTQRVDALFGKGPAAGAGAAPGAGEPEPAEQPAPAAAPSAAASGAPGEPADSGPSPQDLAIPGYDSLSASQVVERLSGLGGEELARIRAYEEHHRARRTILGKIEQLDAAHRA